MHAVIINVTVNDAEAATANLRDNIVPRVREAPGFVAGYWVRLEGGDKGRATIVFESEEGARAVAEQITTPTEGAASDAVTFDGIDVGEVVVSA